MTHAPVEAAKSTKSVVVNSGSFTVPGFLVAAAASGMRYKNRHDLALIVSESDEGATGAGVFTTNLFCAAPVEVCRARLKSRKKFKGILINAGIANACTGEEGLKRAEEMTALAAEALNVPFESILPASTGVIGRQITVRPVEKAMPSLVEKLRRDGWEEAARAIMTTDTIPKMASTKVALGGKTVTIGGIAKGSGMIAPNMATLLAFVCTDAAIDRQVLDYWVRAGAEQSFNRITVDGDTSTNDTLLVLASGRAGNAPLADTAGNESRAFGEALGQVLLDLAKQIVVDGEGATKFIEIQVTGAADTDDARRIAYTIAHSPLVKTAFFGEDANWGRIICAAGRAGVPLDPMKATLYFDGVCVFRNGTPVQGADIEEKASYVFRQKSIHVHLDIGMGASSHTTYTCDLSYDYVKINASYRS